MAEIEIVQPVEGATRVTFDYQAASDALDAIAAMGRRLSDQTGGREAAQADVIVSWQGACRDQFDEAARMLNLRFQAAIEGTSQAPLQIYEAISEANAQQRRYNDATHGSV